MTTYKGFGELPSSTGPKKELTEFQKIKQVRRKNVSEILEMKGVRFTKQGAKLMVHQDVGPDIEFWHGAGRWSERKVGGKFGFGLHTLLEHLGIE